jgi:hypothetical protein
VDNGGFSPLDVEIDDERHAARGQYELHSVRLHVSLGGPEVVNTA